METILRGTHLGGRIRNWILDCEGRGAFWTAGWRCQRARGYETSEAQRELRLEPSVRYLMPRDGMSFPNGNRGEKRVKEWSPGMLRSWKSVKWGGRQVRLRGINEEIGINPESVLCRKLTEDRISRNPLC